MTKDQKDFAKQLHHIIRLYDVLNLDVKVHKYFGESRDFMLDIKRGRLPATKEEAFLLRDEYVTKLSAIYEAKRLSYSPQPIDYESLDAIVMDHYLTTYKVTQ